MLLGGWTPGFIQLAHQCRKPLPGRLARDGLSLALDGVSRRMMVSGSSSPSIPSNRLRHSSTTSPSIGTCGRDHLPAYLDRLPTSCLPYPALTAYRSILFSSPKNHPLVLSATRDLARARWQDTPACDWALRNAVRYCDVGPGGGLCHRIC